MKIVISGVVGVGKSTISNLLANKYNFHLFEEPVEKNPFLDEFYKNPKKIAFQMELFMTLMRSQQLNQSKNFNNVIFDRSILEDPIFVDVLYEMKHLNDTDYKIYMEFYNEVILNTLKLDKKVKIDKVIYLTASAKTAIDRIEKRGREVEKNVDNEYWEVLNKHYDLWYKKFKNHFEIIVIDTENKEPDMIANEIASVIKLGDLDNEN